MQKHPIYPEENKQQATDVEGEEERFSRRCRCAIVMFLGLWCIGLLATGASFIIMGPEFVDSTCTYKSVVSQSVLGGCRAPCSETCIHHCNLCEGYAVTFEVASARCDSQQRETGGFYIFSSSRCFLSGDVPTDPGGSGTAVARHTVP